MNNEEIFGAYVLPAIVSLLAAVAAFVGAQIKFTAVIAAISVVFEKLFLKLIDAAAGKAGG